MKKTFVFLSMLIVALIAYADAKDRLKELDEIGASQPTPSQMERRQVLPPANKKPVTPHAPTIQSPSSLSPQQPKLHEQIKENSMQMQQKREKILERRKNLSEPN